ncbi:MAG TPA: aldehyde dehydrogenase family protein, partial [Pseudobdellovibrionaceae bacterium]|nr:aldehyde dehydrogenase family protein [Pseudobdellovibrionaceae bacterium]
MGVIPVINQFNQETVDEVFATNLIELVQTVRKSKEVQSEWEKVYRDRASLIPDTVKKWLHDYRNQIVFSESLGQGLSLPFVDKHTVQACLDFCEELNLSLTAEQKESKTSYTPTGIIAIISGWNLQLREILSRVVPALMAGNAVIVKVSSRSPGTGQMLMELSRYMSIIAGLQGFSSLIQIVYGSEANQFLCSHPGIHGVSFVGQSKHFKSIISMAMVSNKKIQLSGSAKNCALLLKDFDFVQHGGDLLESIYTASNGLTWSTTRILALESERFRVIDFLRESMSQ